MVQVARVRSVKSSLQKIRKDLEKQQLDKAKSLAESIGEEAVKRLSLTLKNRGFSPGGGFSGAEPNYTYKLQRTRRGVQIVFTATMEDSRGGPHYIWHLLQFGIPQRVQSKTSPKIPVKPSRTVPNTYRSSPASRVPKKVDKWIAIPKGTVIKPVEPRNWYQLLERDLEKVVSTKYSNWNINSSKIRKP